MAALILLVIILIGLALYLTTGWQLAVRNLPRAWRVAEQEWNLRDSVRSSVKEQTVAMITLWPFYKTGILINDKLSQVVDAGNPENLRQRIAEKDQRVRELERRNDQLERELHIGPYETGS